VSACGEEGAGLGRTTEVKPASMKQEISAEPVQIRLNRFR
jgi:putative transposase